jgi:hypothetical protein
MVRNATANNLAEALDFARHDVSAATFAVPPVPLFTPCIGTTTQTGADKAGLLAELAKAAGFAVP